MFDNEPFGYDHDGDGWLDGENHGSLWEYDFDGGGDIDQDDEFIGDFMAYEAHKAGHCFIATAVYGDYDHPQVRELRRFRDQVLLRSAAGRRFVRWYYRVGPGWAEWVEGNVEVKRLIRGVLNSILWIFNLQK